MADNSKIEWTDATFNPVTGCTEVSPGCDHCYAKTFAERWRGVTGHYFENGFDVQLRPDKLTLPLMWKKPRRVFVNSMSDLFHDEIPTGYIAKVFAVMAATPQHTYQILSKRHGRMRSLLNSLEFKHLVAREIDALAVEADHDSVERWRPIPEFEGYEASTHGQIRGTRGVLAPSVNPMTGRDAVTLWRSNVPKTMPVHRLVLMAHVPNGDTSLEACHRNGDKTDNRLANLRWGSRSENQREKIRHGSRGGPQKLTAAQAEEIRELRKQGLTQQVIADQFGISRSLVSLVESGRVWAEPDMVWPLPNVHLGVSCENQQWADIRIPALLATPATVRFLSCEPLLGPIDLAGPVHTEGPLRGGRTKLTYWLTGRPNWGPEEVGPTGVAMQPLTIGPHVDWVIVGGESGHGAKPMHPDWVRTLRNQCVGAGVPFFFKQWGEWGLEWPLDKDGHIPSGARGAGITVANDGTVYQPGDLSYPDGPRYGEALRAGHNRANLTSMYRLGKHTAGRDLDGRTWDEMPRTAEAVSI